MNVGRAETGPLGTGLPAVEGGSAWRRGRNTGSGGSKQVGRRNVLEKYGRYQSVCWCFTRLSKFSIDYTRPSRESPLRLAAHGGFGEEDGGNTLTVR